MRRSLAWKRVSNGYNKRVESDSLRRRSRAALGLFENDAPWLIARLQKELRVRSRFVAACILNSSLFLPPFCAALLTDALFLPARLCAQEIERS